MREDEDKPRKPRDYTRLLYKCIYSVYTGVLSKETTFQSCTTRENKFDAMRCEKRTSRSDIGRLHGKG